MFLIIDRNKCACECATESNRHNANEKHSISDVGANNLYQWGKCDKSSPWLLYQFDWAKGFMIHVNQGRSTREKQGKNNQDGCKTDSKLKSNHSKIFGDPNQWINLSFDPIHSSQFD